MVLPEGLSLELAPRLTPILAASNGFPNRSQVWARCPGRKYGGRAMHRQHSRPTAPTPAQALSQQQGVGGSHPRSSQVSSLRNPFMGAPSKTRSLPPSSRNLEPLGQQPLNLYRSTITIPSLLEKDEKETRRKRGRKKRRKTKERKKTFRPGKLAMPSQVRNGSATHCSPKLWVAEGNLRKLGEQGFRLPLSS